MTLKDLVKSKGETHLSMAEKMFEGNNIITGRLMVTQRLNRDELTLSQYRMFADALGMSLKKLLASIGKI